MKSNLPFLLDEKQLSEWCYEYCRNINDDPEIRKNITDSEYAFLYCKNMNNNTKVMENITHSYWLHKYCIFLYDLICIKREEKLNKDSIK